MTRNDIHDLLIGAVLVALAYALYKHHKTPAPQPETPPVVLPVSDSKVQSILDGVLADTGAQWGF